MVFYGCVRFVKVGSACRSGLMEGSPVVAEQHAEFSPSEKMAFGQKSKES